MPDVQGAGSGLGPYLMSKRVRGGEGQDHGGASTMRFNALWVRVTWGTPCKQTDINENITFPQLRWRAALIF